MAQPTDQRGLPVCDASRLKRERMLGFETTDFLSLFGNAISQTNKSISMLSCLDFHFVFSLSILLKKVGQ